jgi:hypothetical protein
MGAMPPYFRKIFNDISNINTPSISKYKAFKGYSKVNIFKV